MYICVTRMTLANPSVTPFCVTYAITLILSFFICVPLGISLTDFSGQCILFPEGNWTKDNTTRSYELYLASWGRSANCNFILYIGVVCILMSMLFLWKNVVYKIKGYVGTPFYYFITMIGNMLIMFGLLISSFIISIGYNAWCDLVIGNPEDNSQCWNTNLSKFDEKYEVNSNNFSTNIEIAEFGAWTSFLAWFVASFLSFCKVRHFHKHEELLESLAYEKNTLLSTRLRYQRIGEDSDTVS